MMLTNLDLYMGAFACLYIVTAAVAAMPLPQSDRGFYAWLFKFLHLLVNSVDAAFSKRYGQQMPNTETPAEQTNPSQEKK